MFRLCRMMNILSLLLNLGSIFLVLTGCASTFLYTYESQSSDEEAIINLLIVNAETAMNSDLAAHLATYHDDGSIMIYHSN